MKILLAADGSKYTRRAANHLAKHLARFARRPRVQLLHVRPPIPYPLAASFAGRQALDRYEREESASALKVAERVLDKAAIPYRSSWVVGDVADEVARFVKGNKIDMVVMGSHGHGPVTSLALGDTAPKLIAALDVPVMIVK